MFKIGDEVRICVPEHKNTRFGRAGVKNSDVGVVIDLTREAVVVCFPSFGRWHGQEHELQPTNISFDSDIWE